jgi:5-methylthioadenosine/S-adenosylhomocysteine deaminase
MPRDPQPSEPLLPQPLIVTGHLVTFDPRRPEIRDGALYIDRDGVIQAVQKHADPAPAGFDGAARVDTGGLVYPGLIDLHNHIAYNCLPLWIAPDRTRPWTSRDQWPNDRDYKPSVSLPANALCHADGKAVLKYVETKAVIGGVTAIQGSAKVAHPFEGWMVRNVEDETFQTGRKSVNQSVRAFTSEEQYAAAKRDLEAGHAFLYHLAEGTSERLIADFDGLSRHGVLAPKFLGIHATALHAAQFATWNHDGGSIVWSPFSNLWLYGRTTDVVAARAAGMRICLGADWSPSGSKSLLGELKVADLHNRATLRTAFSDIELCAMATCNPADALGWGDKLGRLRRGLRGDFVVMRAHRGKDAYRTLIESTEPDVLLVAINGYPMYGTDELMHGANAVHPEQIQVSPRLRRTITLRDERIPDADMRWRAIVDALEAARRDPGAARATASARAGGEHRLLGLRPDKTWDDPQLNPHLAAAAPNVTIPELDTLTHDAAYFDRVEQATIPAGQLDGLRGYYDGA